MIVPDLFHLNLTAAKATAKNLGFEVRNKTTTVKKVATAEIALLYQVAVVSQKPAKNTEVARGTIIEVEVVHFVRASEADTVKVPDLYHLGFNAAQAAAKKLGLEVRNKTVKAKKVATTNTKLLGQIAVVSQKPAKNTEVAKGTIIEVEVVHFVRASEADTVKVPDLYHLGFHAAQAAAKKLGLEVRNKTVKAKKVATTDTKLLGQIAVVSQIPAKNTEVAKGTIIEVEVVDFVRASQADTVKVPDLYHLGLNAAQAEAKKLGLEVRAKSMKDLKKIGTTDKKVLGGIAIVNQRPAKGVEVSRGKIIEVELAEFVRPTMPPAADPRLLKIKRRGKN